MTSMPTPTAADRGLVGASSFANAQKHRVEWIKDGAIISFTDDALKESPSTPAWYNPKTGDITVNMAAVFEKNSSEYRRALNLFMEGVDIEGAGLLWGLIAHEAAHSAWTTWVPADLDRSLDRRVVNAMVLFEEIRIEKRAIDRGRAHAARLLRQSFAWLLREIVRDGVGDLSSDPLSVAHTWALTYGRYLAGYAAYSEIQPIDSLARTALGDDTVNIMREILGEATGRCSLPKLTELAQEWVDLLKSESESESEGTLTVILHGPAGAGEGQGEPAPGDGSEGEGDPVDEGTTPGGHGYSETDEELAEVMADVIDKICESMTVNPDPPQPDTPLANPQTTASKVFHSEVEKHRKRNSNWSVQDPKPELRAHAARLARTLEALSLPSVTLTHRPSAIPPGRLRGREMVRQGAERSMGMMSTATPWHSTKRRHTSTRPVIVGVATDTSGSMSYATRFVAEFAWIMGTAGCRIGARTAAVTFGENTEAVARPGEMPTTVNIRQANGGHEDFDHAAAALEGVLHYTAAANAAKVLFVVSDGVFVKTGEMLRAQKWLRDFTRSGTLVVWLGVEDGHRAASLTSLVTDKSLVHFTKPGMKDPSRMLAAMEATVVKAARSI